MNKKKLIIDIRIPFCPGHCNFCTKKIYSQEKGLVRRYQKALEAEIAEAAEELAEYDIAAVHIGGGTPAILGGDPLADFLWFLRKTIPATAESQWSIDVLPSELSAATLTVLRNARMNVIHVGAMTSSMKEFPLLNRPYYLAAFDGAMSILTMHQQTGVSVELLVGIPGQTAKSLQESIRYVMGMRPEMISLRPYENWGREKVSVSADGEPLLAAAQSCLAEQGMHRYGSGWDFALPGCERVIYTMEARDYEQMGFGVGAKTCLEGSSYHNTEDMGWYLAHSTEPQVIACI